MSSILARHDRGTTERDMSGFAGKYLTFALGQEEYGLPVLKVREIIKVMDITEVPQVPKHVRGVINLRGKVIAVVDLRLKFGFAAREDTDRTCIIVVEVALSSANVMMGIVVDSVSEVLNVAATDIDEAPDFGDHVTTEYILGLAKVKGTVKILLDLDEVLGSHAAQALDSVRGAALRAAAVAPDNRRGAGHSGEITSGNV